MLENCEDQPCSRLYYAQWCRQEKTRKRNNRAQNSYSWWCWTESYKVAWQQRCCAAEFICYCGICVYDTAFEHKEEGTCSDQVPISCVALQPVYGWSWAIGFWHCIEYLFDQRNGTIVCCGISWICFCQSLKFALTV